MVRGEGLRKGVDAVSARGFRIPKLLAWTFLILGILLFFSGFPVLYFDMFLWQYFGKFNPRGILMIIFGPVMAYVGYKNVGFILRREEVVDRWSILIENGRGRAEDIFRGTEGFIVESRAPKIEMERKEVSPTVLKDIVGVKREFLLVRNRENPRLDRYQIFVNARDYGNNLDVSWYLTYKLGILEAIFALFRTYVPKLDLFDEQDLRAYVTNTHHATLKAVEKLMLSLNQDPSKIDRKSKGFLGVS